MHWLDRLVNNPLALTAKQVAYLLQKSRRWVYRNGPALGGVKVGSTWIFPKEAGHLPSITPAITVILIIWTGLTFI